MDPPPPPYSEQDPSPNITSGQPPPVKRKAVPRSDAKTSEYAGSGSANLSQNYAGHGYEDVADRGASYHNGPDLNGRVSGKGKDISSDSKTTFEDDQFDLDDYYTIETPVEQAQSNQPPVGRGDINHQKRPGLSVETLNISARTHSSPAQLQHGNASSPTPSFLSANSSAVTLPLTPDSSNSNDSSARTKAFRDARHFAGGIIPRPYESKKHITIVRHSHGLVFYQGSRTQVAITLFSDEPIPQGRTLWLQKKGWTGKTGTRMDVTPKPDAKVGVHQLNESDERAWQRDITTFRKKGPAKIRDTHLPRETHIIGIPEGSGDGYFLIDLCLGDKKKVLCQSPWFRVISASKNPSSVKGAPVWAVPLELGIKAGTTALNLYAKNTIGRVTAVAAPVASVATSSASKFMPKSLIGSKVMSKATGMAGSAISSVIADGNARFNEVRNQSLASREQVEAVLQEGPKSPYPITFRGRSETEMSNMLEELNMPNFCLIDVADRIMQQLHGYYFGWARAYDKKSTEEPIWCQAIISVTELDITQLKRVKLGQAPSKNIGLRLMTDFEDMTLEQGGKFEVVVLGFIRPDEPAQRAQLERAAEAGDQDAIDAALISEFNDVSIAQQFLDHPSWSADVATRPKLEERNSSGLQRLGDTYANARATAQKKIDQVGLHKLGMRLEMDKGRSNIYAYSGYYVVR